MIETKQLREALNKIAPEDLQESWDNSGMQIDMGRDYVNRVLVCLEINQAVVEEAINEDADFIITHHPLLFHPTKRIDNHTVEGKYLIDLIFTGISVYSSHTSFDTAPGGNNDDLAQRLELTGITELALLPGEKPAMGRMGILRQTEELKEVAKRLDDVLGNPGGLRVCGDPKRIISKIGLCTGAAGEFFTTALDCGCDLYITGEIKHHEAQMAAERGLAVIEAGHFGTECIFVPNMAQQLRQKFGSDLTVIESKSRMNPVDFVI